MADDLTSLFRQTRVVWAIRAVAALVIGILVLVWPQSTISILAVLLGIYFVILGIVRVIEGFVDKDLNGGGRAANFVIGSTTPAVADGVFVGSIAIALAVYLWSGVTKNQARVVAVVLLLLAAYAFIRGFGLLELAVLRQLGGITAIVIGVILAVPFVRGLVTRK